jgi:Fe2+ or Zn2+ uptake regulation protein
LGRVHPERCTDGILISEMVIGISSIQKKNLKKILQLSCNNNYCGNFAAVRSNLNFLKMQKRNTKTKQWVMDVLTNSQSALCHEDIEKQLSDSIDRVTIYRILQGFCDDGKVHKITGDNGKTYYALCQSCSSGNHHDNHFHFHCLQCNTVTCIDEPVAVRKPLTGYSVTSMSCLISGYCPTCRSLLKTLCMILLFCLKQGNLFAQNQIKVLDKSTNEPVPFANIYYPDTKQKASTISGGISISG